MSENSEPEIDGRPISELKVVELREELGKRGLSKIGNKNALHERLKEFLLEGAKTSGEATEEKDEKTESPQREMTSPNPLVAEYLAKQQTALRAAREDAEAVRRASSGDDASPVREKITRRSRRSKQEAIPSEESSQKPSVSTVEEAVISETEQEATSALEQAETKEEAASEEVKSKEDVEHAADVDRKDEEKGADEGERAEAENEENEEERKECDEGKKVESTASEELIEQEQVRVERNEADDELSVASSGRSDDEKASTGETHTDALTVPVEQIPVEELQSSKRESSDEHDSAEPEKIERSIVETEKSSELEKMTVTSERAVNTTVTETEVKTTNTKSERKRRWKPVEVPKGEDNVVTVTMVEEVNELKEQFMVSEPTVEENRATSFQESITDFKLLTETTDKMEELDYEETVQHTSATDSPQAEAVEAVQQELPKHEERPQKTVERHSRQDSDTKKHQHWRKSEEDRLTVDGFVRKRSVSPARYPVNEVIMIRQLTRPFTVKQLQQLLNTFGTIVEGGFWIDNIKSTCIVKYATVEEAVVARGRLHNIVWPTCSPKTLKVDYSDSANLEKHKAGDRTEQKSQNPKEGRRSGETQLGKERTALRVSVAVDEEKRHVEPAESPKKPAKGEAEKTELRKRKHSPSPRADAKRPRDRRSPWRDDRRRHSPDTKTKSEPEKRVKTADELFLKTKAQPAIYYLPLTEEKVEERAKRKAAEAQLAKKAAQSNVSSTKRKEKEEAEARAEKSSNKRTVSSPSHTRRKSRTPGTHRDRKRSRSRSAQRRR